MIIYKTTNLINGKIYVGKDSHNNSNYFGSGKYIWNAIKKYGKENFKKEIICECNSKEELNKKEIFWIKELNSKDFKIGYNLTDGGDGGSGLHHLVSEETREKLRKPRSKEGKRNMKLAQNRPEVKEKLKISRNSPEWLERNRRPRSEEGKKNMRKPHKPISENGKINLKISRNRPEVLEKNRKPRSEEGKKNMRKPRSEEAKKNIKIGQQKRREKERGNIK